MTRICKFCGGAFVRRPPSHVYTFCSQTCSIKARNSVELADVFWPKVDRATDGCWQWLGARNNEGYGTIQHCRKKAMAHRVSYELNVGPIPLGLLVCHRCDNRICVRPDHLFVGTIRDNMEDMARKGRARGPILTHCVRGLHELTPDNIIRGRSRKCRACNNATQNAAYRARRERRGLSPDMRRQFEKVNCPHCGRCISAYIPHRGDGSDVRIVKHKISGPRSADECPAGDQLMAEYKARIELLDRALRAGL